MARAFGQRFEVPRVNEEKKWGLNEKHAMKLVEFQDPVQRRGQLNRRGTVVQSKQRTIIRVRSDGRFDNIIRQPGMPAPLRRMRFRALTASAAFRLEFEIFYQVESGKTQPADDQQRR